MVNDNLLPITTQHRPARLAARNAVLPELIERTHRHGPIPSASKSTSSRRVRLLSESPGIT
jgi:hypothetical protein